LDNVESDNAKTATFIAARYKFTGISFPPHNDVMDLPIRAFK